MTISIFNKNDRYVWIPVCKKNEHFPPRAFLPFKGIDTEYTYGYKAESIDAKYFDALAGIQKAYINNETKIFSVKRGKKEERQKKAKWRHGAQKDSPLLGPTLGWIKVPKIELETLDSNELANKLIESGENIAEYVMEPNYIESIPCYSDEELNEKAQELILSVAEGVPLGQKTPEKHEATSTGFVRDAAVVAYVLVGAQGKCESCQQNAPFTKESGDPFLEVHHVKPLAEGGSDTVSNAIAACPNCHRELHHGVNKKSLKELIYSRVVRLEIE